MRLLSTGINELARLTGGYLRRFKTCYNQIDEMVFIKNLDAAVNRSLMYQGLKVSVILFTLLALSARIPFVLDVGASYETVIFLPLVTLNVPGPNLGGCAMFPVDHVLNTPIDHLPVDAKSDSYINSIGRERRFHADFGSGTWEGGPIGIPYVIVPGSQAGVPITFEYADESDPGLSPEGRYPIPDTPPIEGGPASNGDRHILIMDKDHCLLYEIYAAYPQVDGSWRAGSGAIFSLNGYSLRPAGWTSADAAGLPILPGLVRYDEVLAGEIKHAIRFTAPRTRQGTYIWPARHYASSDPNPDLPAMGQRFRLRADYNISGFSPQVQVILRAMKKYGIILADNGSAWYLSGVPDERWNNDQMRQLSRLTGEDMEAVDVTSLLLDPDSGKARQP